MDDQPKSIKADADSSFKIVIGDTSAQSPAPAAAATAVAAANAGGLSYQTANADEKARMDKIIAGIDLTNSDTIVALGSQERQKLATLADQVLDSIQPGVKLAFVQALGELITAVKANSLDEIKKRITSPAVKQGLQKVWNAVRGKDNKIEATKDTIGKFMVEISSTRKTIHEMVDKLEEQKLELDKNFDRINALGTNINEAAQDMRIVRAASAEYIRRVEAGEITVLTDLQKIATDTKRADATEKYQLAQTNWNNLRTVDGDLLGSINVYDMNVANLAFTKQANIQNRIQTATTLTTTIAEWKTELAIFAVVTTENAATQLLGVAKELTTQSIKANQELFDTLVDSVTTGAAQGTFNLRQIMAAQGAMATKLESVGPAVEAQFKQLAADKEALEKSSEEFRKRVVGVYDKGAVISDQPAAPKPPAPGR